MKKLMILFIAFAIAVVTSCSDFLDVNTDPNNASSSIPSLTLPAAITSTASVVGSTYNILGGFWVQYWTQDNGSNQYKNIDSYNIQQSDLNTQFSELYSGGLEDYRYVRDQSKTSGDWNVYLMGTVMQCYTFQVLADLYDQVPFDEALQGQANFTPHYLSGPQIYDSLIVRIDNALSKDFGAATVTNPGTSDLVFGGDMNKWKQFANTLKLKIYLRQIYARPEVANAGIQALYASGAKFLDKDAAMAQYIDQENKSNPLYEADQRKLNTANNIRGSKSFIDFLQANGDPRLNKLFIPGTAGQKGLPQGDFGVPTTVINPTSISRALIKATDAVYFLSASESYFLQAEAILRNLGSGDAESLYKSGIEASLLRLDTIKSVRVYKKHNSQIDSATVSYNTVDSLVSTGKVYSFPTSGFDDQLKAIAMQKWVALAGIEGLESFFERNRTGYPEQISGGYDDDAYEVGDLVYPIGAVTGVGHYPKRLLFPQSERSRNPNTPAQVPITTNVWWDVKK